MRKKTKLI